MIGKDTLVMVLAAGRCSRWLNTKTPDLPDQKHLVPIGNTTLLGRTKRQLDERKVPSWLVTNDSELASIWNNIYIPGEIEDFTLSTLLSTRNLWNNDVIVLLGDVFFSHRCFDIVFKDRRASLQFYGNTQDIFAFRFYKTHHNYVITSCEEVLRQSPPSNRSYGKFRDLRWQMLHGSTNPPGNEPRSRVNDPRFSLIQDKTIDVDSMKNYEQLLRRIKRGHLVV